jgi:hypothetical protein
MIQITTNEMAVKTPILITPTISQTELSLNETNEDKNIAFQESVVKKEMHFLRFYSRTNKLKTIQMLLF